MNCQRVFCEIGTELLVYYVSALQVSNAFPFVALISVLHLLCPFDIALTIPSALLDNNFGMYSVFEV